MAAFEREYEVELFGLTFWVVDESAIGAEETFRELAAEGEFGETARELVAAGHRADWTGATR